MSKRRKAQKEKTPSCLCCHVPNKKTAESIEESKKGPGIQRFNSMDDFWKSIGVN